MPLSVYFCIEWLSYSIYNSVLFVFHLLSNKSVAVTVQHGQCAGYAWNVQSCVHPSVPASAQLAITLYFQPPPSRSAWPTEIGIVPVLGSVNAKNWNKCSHPLSPANSLCSILDLKVLSPDDPALPTAMDTVPG